MVFAPKRPRTPANIATLEALQIIRIDAHGDITVADMNQSHTNVIEQEEATGPCRAVVDATRVTSMPFVVSLYDFGLGSRCRSGAAGRSTPPKGTLFWVRFALVNNIRLYK